MSETHLYEGIARTLSDLIERGVLRPGDRMRKRRIVVEDPDRTNEGRLNQGHQHRLQVLSAMSTSASF